MKVVEREVLVVREDVQVSAKQHVTELIKICIEYDIIFDTIVVEKQDCCLSIDRFLSNTGRRVPILTQVEVWSCLDRVRTEYA